jgi:hypothetical protein
MSTPTKVAGIFSMFLLSLLFFVATGVCTMLTRLSWWMFIPAVICLVLQLLATYRFIQLTLTS